MLRALLREPKSTCDALPRDHLRRMLEFQYVKPTAPNLNYSDEPGTYLKQKELYAIRESPVMDSFSNCTEKFDILTS